MRDQALFVAALAECVNLHGLAVSLRLYAQPGGWLEWYTLRTIAPQHRPGRGRRLPLARPRELAP